MRSEVVYLGLGSNVGDRVAHLRAGLRGLRQHGLRLRAVSSFYVTEPDLRTAATDETQEARGEPGGNKMPEHHPWYINCVAGFDRAPPPRTLLEICLEIERAEGRERRRAQPGSNGAPRPRTLDIDLLLFGERVIDEADLVLPHPRMAQRRFVLAPLAEIAPRLRHPVSGATIAELLDELPERERVELIEPQPVEVP